MYTRLLERKELYEIAVGSFPRVFSEAIRRQVSHNVSGAIESHSWVLEELEQLRSNLHLQALEELWNATSSEFSISQDFISGIRKIQQIIFDNPMQFGLDSCDEYSHNKGLLGNDIWDRISVKQSESNLHDLYALYNQRGVWAFAMELKGHTYLIPPIFFPDILSSTLGITKLKIRNEWQVSHKPDDSIKLDKLEKIAAESMLPLHEKIFRFGNMTPYPPPPEIPSIDELMRVRVARIELELNI
jgi:hypothetical protein